MNEESTFTIPDHCDIWTWLAEMIASSLILEDPAKSGDHTMDAGG